MEDAIIENGLFIVLEGNEGSGKTTLAKSLKEHYESIGYEVLLTRNPGGTKLAEDLRNIVVNRKMDNLSELFIFCAAIRDNIINEIIPALQKGKVVICDRYITSTIIYQCIMPNNLMINHKSIDIDAGYIDIINCATEGLIPDVEILLDVDIKTSMDRIRSRKEKNKFDITDKKWLRNLKKAYLVLADSYTLDNCNHHCIIDGNKDKESVLLEAVSNIDEFIKENYE